VLHERVIVQRDWWLAVAFGAVALNKGTIAEIELVSKLLTHVPVDAPKVVT
jgi:hypothetical protein